MIFEIQRGCVTRLGVVKQKSLWHRVTYQDSITSKKEGRKSPNLYAANNFLPFHRCIKIACIQPGIAIAFKGHRFPRRKSLQKRGNKESRPSQR
jgi:hypothetical protein